MKPLGSMKRHVLLVNGMAQSIGADLVTAQAEGALPQEAYAEMVNRCRGCSQPGACESMLRGPEETEAIPAYCCNADILRKLVP